MINHTPDWIFISGIPSVFLASGILRLAASLVLLPTLKEARLIEMGVGHSFFKRYITIRPSEGLVFEVIGKYHKVKEKLQQVHDYIKTTAKSGIKDAKESRLYTKKLLKYIDKNVSAKKEQHELTNMHEIEKITEQIEKGKMKK
mgnify:CR=1 FL=1